RPSGWRPAPCGGRAAAARPADAGRVVPSPPRRPAAPPKRRPRRAWRPRSSPPAMAAQLQAGEVDLCLASQPLPGPGLASAELLSEEVLLAVPPSHRLAGRTRAGVGELAGEPFVTTRPGYWQRALTDRLFADAVIVCEGDEPYAIRGLISAGVGIGLMPAMARRLAPDPPVGWLH